MQIDLPKWISTNLDYRSFKRASESFVNEQLQEYFSDIIYTCRWKGGKEALQLSFILEHKSYVPGNILLQLLRYLSNGTAEHP